MSAARLPNPRLRQRNLPLSVELAAKRLYVVGCQGPGVIADALGLTPRQVGALAHRRGWTQLREKRREKAIAKADRQIEADQANEVDTQRIQDATAILAEDLTIRTLETCSERLDEKNDKGVSMLSTAARNFHEITRKARNLDRRESTETGGMTLNLFVARSNQRAERNVTPDTRVAADPIPVRVTQVA
jgi:hypothetical protein